VVTRRSFASSDAAQNVAEAGEHRVVGGADDDVAVGRAKSSIRNDRVVGVALWAHHLAADQIDRRRIDEGRQLHAEQRELDSLALSRPLSLVQSGTDRGRSVKAGGHVQKRDASFDRRAAGQTGDAHHAA